MKKVEVSEEGIVFCDGITCSNWIECENTCEGCPIDKLFKILHNHYVKKSNS